MERVKERKRKGEKGRERHRETEKSRERKGGEEMVRERRGRGEGEREKERVPIEKFYPTEPGLLVILVAASGLRVFDCVFSVDLCSPTL